MHEISLVQGLLKQLESLAHKHNTTSISKVRLEVGPFSGIVVDSFEFGFDILAKESELTKKAELEIIIPPMQYKCTKCAHLVSSDSTMPKICPKCTNTLLMPEGGADLILLQVEMK